MSKEKEIVETVKVYLRRRPFLKTFLSSTNEDNNDSETPFSGIESIAENHKSCLYNSAQNKIKQQFSADYIFDSDSKQKEIYETVAKPIVQSCLEGYSGVILAYGPTSSGKTFTMRGTEHDNRGIMPRCIEEILSYHQKIEVWASYMQIYCENITDLLSPPDPLAAANPANANNYYESGKLVIREKPDGNGVYVDGLSKQRISSLDDLWDLLSKGDQNRCTAATNLNEQSSRSHAILMLSVLIPEGVNFTDDDDEEEGVVDETAEEIVNNSKSTKSYPNSNNNNKLKNYKEGKLLLVDLAGSERAKASEGRDYMRLEEAKAINLSLSALGNCMNALAEGRSYIPYRDSKLTRLLTNSLGGTSRTSLIVNIIPDNDLTSETLNALRFASRASKVKVNAKISKIQNYELLYKELLSKLQQQQQGSSSSSSSSSKSIGNSDRSKDYQQLVKEKQSQLDEKDIEISLLKQQLAMVQQENAILLSSKSSSSSNNLKESSEGSSSQEEIQRLKQQLETITKEQLQSLQSQYNILLKRYQEKERNIQQLHQQQHELQQDLFQEKENHFKTIQEMKKIHENYYFNDKNFQTRLEDLLSTINQQKNDLENKEQLIKNLSEERKELAIKVISYENHMHSMVSYEQVKEMEMLFMETITKLTERVQSLESTRTSPNGGGGGGFSTNKPIGSLNPIQSSGNSMKGGGGSQRPPQGNSQKTTNSSSTTGNSNNNSKYQHWTPTASNSSLLNPELLLDPNLFQADHPADDQQSSQPQQQHQRSNSVGSAGSSDRVIRLEPGKIRTFPTNNGQQANGNTMYRL